MKNSFFFFATLFSIYISRAQVVHRIDSNAANLPVAANKTNALATPAIQSVTIVNKPCPPLYNQTWMQKNLNVAKYRNGDPIPDVKDSVTWANLTTGAWCYYDNDPANGKIYGKLYNWYAVNDPRGLAPEGWHIPNDSEWTAMFNGLGGTELAGGELKEVGRMHWKAPNDGATNSTGFYALPGGDRSLHSSGFFKFRYKNCNGYWWGSTEYLTDSAWSYIISHMGARIVRTDFSKQNGFYVRCVKD